MSVNYKNSKNRIYLRRVELGLSQEELANKLKISRSSLVRYEKGENIPSDVLKLLAKKLDVSADYLLNLSHNKSEANEYLWKEFALEDECIEKIRTIAHITANRNYILAIDTINYLFKYSNIELIEYVGEYLNTPLPKEVDYKIDGKITRKQKSEMNEQRKYEAEKFMVLQEVSKLFEQIKSSKKKKKKYGKYKVHIERFDRPITKLTEKQLNRLGIEKKE